jgi:UDP-glucose-4-epimerase GalE
LSGHETVTYDNLFRGHAQAVKGRTFVQGDLLDRGLLDRTFADHRPDAVMHFAALAFVGESVHEPAMYYLNNVVGTVNLLESMRQADVRRIVFSSTCATYGIPEHVPIRESEKQQPINPYGFTKLTIERALADYSHAYDFGYAALRYFNAAGAAEDGSLGEDHTPETHLIPLVLQVALGQRKRIEIFGDDYDTPDGTCIRDYVHVDDLARAHVSALEQLKPGSELKLNLGTGHGASVKEVIEVCQHVTGRTIATKVAARREGDPARLVADPSAANRVLDWIPKFGTVRPIVETAWNWHKRHPHGYQART